MYARYGYKTFVMRSENLEMVCFSENTRIKKEQKPEAVESVNFCVCNYQTDFEQYHLQYRVFSTDLVLVK